MAQKANHQNNAHVGTDAYKWLPAQYHLIILTLISFLVYGASLSNDFCWDDFAGIVKNTMLNSKDTTLWEVTMTPLLEMFTPLTNALLYFNFLISHHDSQFYHFINLVIHILVVTSLYKFIQHLTQANKLSFLTALIFAVHPINVEATAWISARSTLLSDLFIVLSMIQYLKYLQTKKTLHYLLTLFIFMLACLSKTTAIVLAGLLLAIDIFYFSKITLNQLLNKIPFLIIGAFFIYYAIHIRYDENASALYYGNYNSMDRVMISIYSFTHYILAFLLPIGLTCSAGLPILTEHHLPIEFYASVAVIPILIFLFIYFKKHRKNVIASYLFYFAAISPMLHFIPFGRDIVADRYAYLPMMLFSFLAASFILKSYSHFKIQKRYNLNWFAPLVIAIIFTLAIGANQRSLVWKNNTTLLSDAIAKKPDNYFPSYALALYYIDNGMAEKSIPYFNLSLSKKADQAEAHYNRGLAYALTGKNSQAQDDFTKAIYLQPNHALSYYNRGTLLGSMNRLLEAKNDLDSAIKYSPDYSDAYFNRGMASLALGDTLSACSDWQISLTKGNEIAEARIQLHCQ